MRTYVQGYFRGEDEEPKADFIPRPPRNFVPAIVTMGLCAVVVAITFWQVTLTVSAITALTVKGRQYIANRQQRVATSVQINYVV